MTKQSNSLREPLETITPEFITGEIMQAESFVSDVQALAVETGMSEEKVSSDSKRYLKELVPSFSERGLKFLIRFSRFVYTRGYKREIDTIGSQVQMVKDVASQHPIAYLMNHRSQVDSFSIYSGFYDSGVPHPYGFGGINMNMFGMGNALKGAGLTFIRRSFNDNPVYKNTLQRLIDWYVRTGQSLFWSIEGGRSRSGKLLKPRLGLLNWVVDAHTRVSKKDLYFVPVAIAFEQISDVSAYTYEQLGGTKKPEDLQWFLRYISSFKTSLGQIFVRFGEPLSLNELIQDAKTLDSAKDSNKSLILERIAFETSVRINDCTPVTRTSLVAMAVLRAVPDSLSLSELQREVQELVDYLRHFNRPAIFDLEENINSQLKETLDSLISTGIITCYDGGFEPVYTVNKDKELYLSYYRNNAIHFFVPGAIAEIALAKIVDKSVEQDRLQLFWEEVDRVKNYLKFEFFYPKKSDFMLQMQADLDFRFPGWMDAIRNGHGDLRRGVAAIKPMLAVGSFAPYIEAYRVVARALSQQQGAKNFEPKSFQKQCLDIGLQLHLQQRIKHKESIGTMMFSNGIKLAKNLGLMDGNQTPEQLSLAQRSFANELLEIDQQLQTMRSIAQNRRISQSV